MPKLGWITETEVQDDQVLDEWVCVLLRGGGFRPCRVIKIRTRLGPEVYTKLVDWLEPIQGYRLAIAEAKDWAEYLKVRFIDWP